MALEPWAALLAVVAGYLLGSISFARIIAHLVAPTADISHVVEPVPRSSDVFQTDSVSATAVRIHVGTRYGCLTAILDMVKVALPTLVLRLWQPEQPYYLIVAAAGLVGHNWPIYHRFQGGRGESSIYGALLVIDPLGVVVTNAVGALLGVVLGQLLVLRWAGMVLMIPWLWLRIGEWAPVLYMVFANAVYWVAMSPELRQFFQLLGKGTDPSQEELAEFLGMGKRLGRFLDRYSAPALVGRLAGRKPKA
jgi:acyl phosphate:glycerol-3-phosphate acyltransferase